MRRGWLGEVLLQDNGIYRTELRGLTQVFSQNVVESFSSTCRADLGDSRCKIAISDAEFTKIGSVDSVTNRAEFAANVEWVLYGVDERAPSGWFDGGLVAWLTGDNAGSQIEIQNWTLDGSLSTSNSVSGAVTLFLPTGYPIQQGDTFTIRLGCDKLKSTCINKFSNIINFRGEPYVPGIDQIMKSGSQ